MELDQGRKLLGYAFAFEQATKVRRAHHLKGQQRPDSAGELGIEYGNLAKSLSDTSRAWRHRGSTWSWDAGV